MSRRSSPAEASRPRSLFQRFIDLVLAPFPPRYIEGVVRRLPPGIVRVLVRIAHAPYTLGWVPGWRFGDVVDRANKERSMDVIRRTAWAYFEERTPTAPVRLRWLRGTELWSYLGNDVSFPFYVGGCVEPNELSLLAHVLCDGMVFIDVGANEGLFTVLAARSVGAEGIVVAIEPSSRDARRLAQNVALNKLSNVRLKMVALGDRRGHALLYVASPLHPGQNTFGRFVYPGVSATGTEDVELTTLDVLIDEEKLSRVDVVKIDVEGAEGSVLRGGAKTLDRFRPLLIIEVLGPALAAQGSSAANVLGLLRELGYEMFVFDEYTARLQPLMTGRSGGYNVVAVHTDRPWPALQEVGLPCR